MSTFYRNKCPLCGNFGTYLFTSFSCSKIGCLNGRSAYAVRVDLGAGVICHWTTKNALLANDKTYHTKLGETPLPEEWHGMFCVGGIHEGATKFFELDEARQFANLAPYHQIVDVATGITL